ncbi:MAG: putative lipid II flippase FtsW [PVC group bacterium]|nr:putative lipid II flippase FtsW [PVC group bacterium]
MDIKQTRISVAGISVVLLCIGIVMIYSASAIYAYEVLEDSAFYLKRHLFYVLIGLVCAVGAMLIDYDKLRKWSKRLLILSFFLLLLLWVPGLGKQVGGARRWFRIWIFSFQPSELAKFAMIVYTADFLARKKSYIQSFAHGFLPALIVLLLMSGLILIQPDLGTVMAMSIIFFIMFFIGGVKLTHITALILSSLPCLYVLIFSVPYRRNRILAFLDPWKDPHGTGFQIIQSLVALGSGGISGVGLGHGKQKLLYLPAAYTDFIFSIIGEEMGFIGTATIVFLCIMFLFYATKISLKAKDSFGQFLSFGLLSGLIIEAIINMAVVTSIFPTKGLPFPFISYGGTSLVFNMIYVGLILNIGRSR